MSEWKIRRFWTEAKTERTNGGFAILLDSRPVRTPAKQSLVVPTEALAAAIAKEWQAQEGEVDPNAMPFTRTANSAIDKVAAQQGQVADMLAAYGDSDLLCYRAQSPEALVKRQAQCWDPALDWAARVLGARLTPTTGLIHVAQPPEALQALSKHVHRLTHFELAAFHDLVTLTGSLILGFAAARAWRDGDAIWEISRIDEIWQAEQWGQDEEAAALADSKRRAFLTALKFFDFSSGVAPSA